MHALRPLFSGLLLGLLAIAGSASAAEPDLIGVGVGSFDFARSRAETRAVDVRLDYRWGLSLLSAASSSLAPLDRYVQIHPFVGFETTTKTQTYFTGGLAIDVLPSDYVYITPSVGFGLYERGEGKDLGAIPEFRSTLEAGLRFNEGIRMGGYVAHISNAGISDKNPGAEMIGLLFHVPTNKLFP
jgi:hypothetical protein